ncbi:MAG TPA: hypothetical protein VJO12_07390 [Stellaceae bacterium]|nr:hypothetical protein [Stellaceae bacterium]
MPGMWKVVAGLALLLLWGATAHAQDQVVDERLDASVSAPLHNTHFDIVVVTVVAVESGPFTNADPPQGLVRVDETLRGGEPVGAIYPARWSGHVHDDDYADRGGMRDGNWVPPQLKPEWHQHPLASPKPGDQVIVFAAGVAEFKSIWAQAAFRLTPENRAFAVAHMAPLERSAAIQTPAFLLILLAPLACVILHILLRSSAVSASVKFRLRLALWLLLFLVPAVYDFYESGISIHSNIRVDLLLLWPAIALTLAIAAASLLTEKRPAQA